MRYHIVLSRVFDLEGIGRESDAGKRPRLGFKMLADRLDAVVHMPKPGPVAPLDRIRARLTGRADLWAMAREIDRQVGPDDVIYCSGEDVAFPIAGVSGARPDRPKLALFAHNLVRPRAKLAMKWLRMGECVDLFVTNIRSQVEFLRGYLRLPESKLHLIQDQTDVKFFTPGPPSPGKTRPIVASVGLESRDYRTLAAATADLDVDVRISANSPEAAVLARTFPETLPANMDRRSYEWPDLVQLYRDADVVALSLFECRYSAGITTLMEGLSCRRPMVVTRTEGLAEYLPPDGVATVPNGDPDALKAAIIHLLDDPAEARALADRGYELGVRRHDSDRFVEELAGRLAAL